MKLRPGRIVDVIQVEAPGLGWVEVNCVSRRANSMCKGPEASLPTVFFHAHWQPPKRKRLVLQMRKLSLEEVL